LVGLVVLVLSSITLGLFIGLLNSVDIENRPNNRTSLESESTGIASKVLKNILLEFFTRFAFDLWMPLSIIIIVSDKTKDESNVESSNESSDETTACDGKY
jgi:hypothetical protein